MKKRMIHAAALASVMYLILSACGGQQTSAPANNAPAASTPATAPTEPAAETPATLTGTGVYNGQADPHTVEIEMDGKPLAFQLGEGVDAQIAPLKEGDAVSFEYTEEPIEGEAAKLLTLTKISKTEDEATGGGNDTAQGDARPATATFEVNLEGTPEERTAELAQGEGYSLYVFDSMSLFPDQNRVALAVDDNYYAEITKLPADFNLDTLEKEGMEELAATGEVEKVGDTDIPADLEGAKLFLTATGNGVIQKYIVLEKAGQGFAVKINVPQGGALEGFMGHIYITLNTLQ
ncbi:hypothetical protein OIN60_16075 [Paenibacillus sp. P96]|uniref:Uncharacterized protein n=1 Tax=Paenibacillus zeirhizosphaerae TaxID=2987519 RepID=A0ABT9FUU1_9BACL|nr:hypothetical protein [Paenibacillus sp. P96]MDP4098276.1 hypothetical protein [Paenibacillus sp. P96]